MGEKYSNSGYEDNTAVSGESWDPEKRNDVSEKEIRLIELLFGRNPSEYEPYVADLFDKMRTNQLSFSEAGIDVLSADSVFITPPQTQTIGLEQSTAALASSDENSPDSPHYYAWLMDGKTEAFSTIKDLEKGLELLEEQPLMLAEVDFYRSHVDLRVMQITEITNLFFKENARPLYEEGEYATAVKTAQEALRGALER